jgi:hypothetical protein
MSTGVAQCPTGGSRGSGQRRFSGPPSVAESGGGVGGGKSNKRRASHLPDEETRM